MPWDASQIWLLMVCVLTTKVSASNDSDLLAWSTDDNKTKIAKSGALVPLTRLARSKDMRRRTRALRGTARMNRLPA